MKNDTIKMNMRNAVLYAESMINRGESGFFMRTEFGKIGVEINPFNEVDPLHPAEVLLWEQCPKTAWTILNANESADYYVGINIFNYCSLDHMAVIEAISRVMLHNVGFDLPSDNTIMAMISSYMSNYDEVNTTINTITSEYMSAHMSYVIRMSPSVQTCVREMFQQKLDSGRDIIEVGSELISVNNVNGSIPDDYFADKYSEEVFGILLYCHMKQKKSLDGVLHNMVKFKDIPNASSQYQKQIAANGQ